jgi:predicted O-methyltransferase YrrM
MNFNEAQALFDAVQNSAGNILEIGRRFGGSTVLINVAANRRLVVSVDNCPAHMDICEAYFQTCAPKPMLLIQDSRIRLEIPFGCVFIDGDHSLAGVLADTIVHWPTIVPQGIVIYHDAVAGAFGSREGVTAVAETLLRERCVDVVSSADSLIVFRKIMELPIDFGTRCGYLPQSGPPEMA